MRTVPRATCSGAPTWAPSQFLTPELNKHRKVLELVGSKLKTAKAAEQLSGLGFSSTVRDSVVVRVKGAFNRVIRVAF